MSALARRVHALSVEQWGERGSTVMVGQHPSLEELLHRLLHFAQAESPVLITGETGTGKELFARALYLLSKRRRKPMLSVNCAQYTDGQLIASELFGHRRGSFTGAIADHRGVFVDADGGIVFLDELGELSAAAQAMLLRVLSEGEVVPVGDTRPVRVDVRVVAATSRDLRALVAAGRFRADLYYRLRFLQLRVPALRERGSDWQLMLSHYVTRCSAQAGQPKRFSATAVDLLTRYWWPGNVRELRGLVDAGYHTSTSNVIEPDDFSESIEEPLAQTRRDDDPTAFAGRAWAPSVSAGPGRPADVGAHGGAYRVMSSDAPVPRLPAAYADTASGPATPSGGVDAGELLRRMGTAEANFWDHVHTPFMERELNRAQVRQVIFRGLAQSGGSYKRLLGLLGIVDTDYLRFMDFLRHHRLKPER